MEAELLWECCSGLWNKGRPLPLHLEAQAGWNLTRAYYFRNFFQGFVSSPGFSSRGDGCFLDAIITCVVCDLHIGRERNREREKRERDREVERRRVRRNITVVNGREQRTVGKRVGHQTGWRVGGPQAEFPSIFGSLYSRMINRSFKGCLHGTSIKPYLRHKTNIFGHTLQP